jgi:hypothetical protein
LTSIGLRLEGVMEFWTAREVRGILKVSKATYHRLLSAGLPSIGNGRLRRFEPDATWRWFTHYARSPRIPARTYACVRCRIWWTIPPRVSPKAVRCRACGGDIGPATI